MVESYLRQSPLAQQGLEGRAEAVRGSAGVAMSERRFPGIVDLRGAHKAISACLMPQAQCPVEVHAPYPL